MNDEKQLPQDHERTDASDRAREFEEALRGLKDEVRAGTDPTPEASERIWSRIEEETREPLRRVDRPPQVYHRRRVRPHVWMGIATAVILAAVVTLLMMQGAGEALVAAAESEIVEYTAADGSMVILRPNSELYLIDASEESIRYRIEGEAFFSVTPRDRGLFSVEAGEAVIQVLGTRFNVSTWGPQPSVYLEEGRVRFAHEPSGADVILEPGQWSRITDDGDPLQPVQERGDEYLDWIDGEIVFEQQPVRLVADELEHHFRIDLEIAQEIEYETLTGRILLDDEGQSLEDLGRVMDGRFVEVGPRAYHFEPE